MEDIIDTTVIDMRGCSVNEALKVSGSRDTRVRTGAALLGKENFTRLTNVGAGSTNSFGATIRSMLQLGSGYSTEVSDFGEAVSIKITYSNARTAKSASQNFLVLFYDNGQCRAKVNSTRWRTCNDIGQAASYIRSKASRLQAATSYAE